MSNVDRFEKVLIDNFSVKYLDWPSKIDFLREKFIKPVYSKDQFSKYLSIKLEDYLKKCDKYFNLENGWLDIFLGQTQPIAYLALFAALIMFYYFLPNVRIPKIWYVFPGAAFVLFIMATTGKLFSLYLDNYANRIFDFRSATAVIFLVFMVWFIFMAQILIIGAVVNASVHKLKLGDIQSRDGDIVSIFRRAKAKYKKNE